MSSNDPEKKALEGGAIPEDTIVKYDTKKLKAQIKEWTKRLHKAAELVAIPASSSEPFKNIYAAIADVSIVNFQVDAASVMESIKVKDSFRFWVRFTKIHVLSSLAKFYENCEEHSRAVEHHQSCIELIEEELSQKQDTGRSSFSMNMTEEEDMMPEILKARERMKYLYTYGLTRYAILCSERGDQDKSLALLKKAEEYYHENSGNVDILSKFEPDSLLGMLDSLNSESLAEMFTYILFYLGQAWKIQGEKERAVLYLHMVLRRQLESESFDSVRWGSDASRMAAVLMVNAEAYETSRRILVASTVVMKRTPEEEKKSDNFKQNWADLGRSWAKFGVALLEISCERLKDLEEENIRKIKFQTKMKFNKYERLSLGINDIRPESDEYDALPLITSLTFPTLDVTGVDSEEMKGKFVRDFDEARAVFLPAQKWINIAKGYYTLEEFAGDFIDITTDYVTLFKYLVFFEPSRGRQIKMEKRRIKIMEELLSSLNSKVYTDVFHGLLRELAETYESVYKLKVDECKERGKSLRPSDVKLVQWIMDAVKAHKRNLNLFGFDIDHAEKSFPTEHEKILMACVLSSARMLGSLCHDHPLHPDAINHGEESKRFYKYFMEYLDRRTDLKKEFITLYEGSQDMPDLLETQIRKIQHHQRVQEAFAHSQPST